MGYCRQPTRTYVLPRGVYSGWGIVFSLLVHTFLKIFKIFEKSDFLGRPRPFFAQFFQYIRGHLGRAASQEIYAGMVLFADFESI